MLYFLYHKESVAVHVMNTDDLEAFDERVQETKRVVMIISDHVVHNQILSDIEDSYLIDVQVFEQLYRGLTFRTQEECEDFLNQGYVPRYESYSTELKIARKFSNMNMNMARDADWYGFVLEANDVLGICVPETVRYLNTEVDELCQLRDEIDAQGFSSECLLQHTSSDFYADLDKLKAEVERIETYAYDESEVIIVEDTNHFRVVEANF